VTNQMRGDWDDDQQLLADLGEAVRAVQGLAEQVAERGKEALTTWSSLDDELLLACVSFDSLLETSGVVRSETGTGAGTGRLLVFSAEPLSVELEVGPGGVVGQVVPPAPAQVQLEAADGTVQEASADDLGFFTLGVVPRGPVRLRCDTATSRLVTHWVELG
jgi:hypothetical protein